MSKKHEALIPVSTTRIDPVIVPEHKIESPTTGECAIDQQAIVHNPKTCKAIFEEGMATGAFNDCKNAAQVNALISKIKNGGKTPTPYFVSEVSHAYTRTEQGWVKRSDAELAADPFSPGVRGERKSALILDPLELDALKAQAAALSVLKDNPAIAPLLASIEGKLKAHEAALLEDATRQANVRKRAATLEAVRVILLANDKTGGKALTLTIAEDGVVTVG
jgi:hypothetical protein